MAEILCGSKPAEGGHLLLTDEERAELLVKEPDAEKIIAPMISAHEFINGENRWCIWLDGANPTEWRRLSEIMHRVQAVRAFREKSKKAATVRLAEVPYLFGEIRQPTSNFVLFPLHSSENRKLCSNIFLSIKFHCE